MNYAYSITINVFPAPGTAVAHTISFFVVSPQREQALDASAAGKAFNLAIDAIRTLNLGDYDYFEQAEMRAGLLSNPKSLPKNSIIEKDGWKVFSTPQR